MGICEVFFGGRLITRMFSRFDFSNFLFILVLVEILLDVGFNEKYDCGLLKQYEYEGCIIRFLIKVFGGFFFDIEKLVLGFCFWVYVIKNCNSISIIFVYFFCDGV